VDATGRRKLLQTKLGLTRESPHKASAVWFRMEGRLDIDDLVSPAHHEWHARVPGRMRYFSTNHLLGNGYWVWLIPLGSGNTSFGIVTDENIHPIRTYATVARRSVARHGEPQVAGI
jgi:flavin-dependent dehydrogenase